MKIYRKLLSLVMCLCVLTSVLSVGVQAEEAVAGDIDGDGIVSIEDARQVLRMSTGIIEENLELADLNGDGYVSVADAIQTLYLATNIGGVIIPDKNGDNYLADYEMDPDNYFINLIADTYNVDPASLVAVYSIPDDGTNYVLQFGHTSGVINKEYEKSADNLELLYHIGLAPERKISYTDGKLTGGNHYNCQAYEGWMTFKLVKSDVMAQYPDYFIL